MNPRNTDPQGGDEGVDKDSAFLSCHLFSTNLVVI